MDPGTTLGGRYRLRERLGSGRLGTVWEATDTVLDRQVAIKIVDDGIDGEALTAERFRRAATAAAALTHRNTVTIYDVGAASGRPLLVMALVDGAPLSALSAHGPLSAGVAATVGGDVARGLQAVHDHGLVHGDLKPSNVLLSPGGEARICDVGLARAAVGGAAGGGPRDDLRMLGRMLEQLAAGGTAEGPDADALPANLQAVIAAATGAAGQDRAPDARSLADALDGLTTGEDRTQLARLVRGARRDPPPADPRATVTQAIERPAADPAAAGEGRQTTVMARPTVDASRPTATMPTPQQASWWARNGRRVLLGVLLVAILGAGTATLRMVLSGPAGAPDSGQSAAPPTTSVGLVSAADFDPFSEGQAEHPEDVGLAIDGDPATVWSTEHYDAPLQDLKPGVGLWVELSQSTTPARIELRLPLEGVDLEVYLGAGPPAGTEPGGWGRRIGRVSDAGATVTLEPSGEPAGRYLLIWLTGLAPDGDRRAGEIGEITVLDS